MTADSISYILEHNLVSINAKKLNVESSYRLDFEQDVYEILLNNREKFDSLLQKSPKDLEKYLYKTMTYHKLCAHHNKYIKYDRRHRSLDEARYILG